MTPGAGGTTGVASDPVPQAEGGAAGPVVVIGVGNPFRRDDGVGPAVLEALRDRDDLPPGTRLVDSDGEPTSTIIAWEDASVAVLIDAVRTGAPPGTVHLVDPDAVPDAGRPGSSHALGPGEAVRLGRATGRVPDRLVLIGVEVVDTAMGVGLTPEVAGAVDEVVRLVVRSTGTGTGYVAGMDATDADVIEMLTRAARSTEAVLQRLGPADHDRPSPCPEMTVAQVAAHLIGGIRGFADVAEGGELRFDADLDPDLRREPAPGAFRSAMDRLVAAFSEPGRIDSTYAMPWGPTTGVQLIGFELIETVVHGWDVARGLGVEMDVDDDVADATLAGARMWIDDSVRVPQMFGPAVSVGEVPPLDELVAFLGRDPAWPGSSATT